MQVKSLFTSLVDKTSTGKLPVKTVETESFNINDNVQLDSSSKNEETDKSKELSMMALKNRSNIKSTGEVGEDSEKPKKAGKAICLLLAGVSMMGALGAAFPGTAAAQEPVKTEVHQEVQSDTTQVKKDFQEIGKRAKSIFTWGRDKVTESVKDFGESATKENHTDKDGNFTIVNQKYKKQLNDFLDENKGKTEDGAERTAVQTVVETGEVIGKKTVDTVKKHGGPVVETVVETTADVLDRTAETAEKAVKKAGEEVKEYTESLSKENYRDENGNFTIVNQKYKKQLGNFLNRLTGNQQQEGK